MCVEHVIKISLMKIWKPYVCDKCDKYFMSGNLLQILQIDSF